MIFGAFFGFFIQNLAMTLLFWDKKLVKSEGFTPIDIDFPPSTAKIPPSRNIQSSKLFIKRRSIAPDKRCVFHKASRFPSTRTICPCAESLLDQVFPWHPQLTQSYKIRMCFERQQVFC